MYICIVLKFKSLVDHDILKKIMIEEEFVKRFYALKEKMESSSYTIYKDFTQKIIHGVSTGKIILDPHEDTRTITLYDKEGEIMDYTLLKPENNFELTGKKVEVVYKGVVYQGIVLSIQDRRVSLYTGHRTVILSDYESIIIQERFGSSPDGPCSLQVRPGYFTLSTLNEKLTWSSYVQLLVDPLKDQGHLILKAIILNPRGYVLCGEISLLAGKVYRLPDKDYESYKNYESSPKAFVKASDDVEVSPVSEMMRYDLGNVKDLKGQEIGVVLQQSFLSVKNIYQARWVLESSPLLKVEYGYSIRTPFFIPSSGVTIYENFDGVPLILGQDRISETQAEEEKTFFIGQTSRIQIKDVKEVQTPLQVVDDIILAHKIKLEATIYNSTKDKITLDIWYDVGKSNVEDLNCPTPTLSRLNSVRKGSDLVWTVTTSQEKLEFSCQFLLRHARS